MAMCHLCYVALFLLLMSLGATKTAKDCCKRCIQGKPCGDTCISHAATCTKPKGCACGCCRVCGKGKACGDTCISKALRCTIAGGCACNHTTQEGPRPSRPNVKPQPYDNGYGHGQGYDGTSEGHGDGAHGSSNVNDAHQYGAADGEAHGNEVAPEETDPDGERQTKSPFAKLVLDQAKKMLANKKYLDTVGDVLGIYQASSNHDDL